MKILYAVQRYGETIVGGSEAAARMFAERLVERGHEVDVVTSCALSYVDWANAFEPGTSQLNGVTVHRLPVSAPRAPEIFGPYQQWMIDGPKPAPAFVQSAWAKQMGPDITDLSAWISANAGQYDLAVFMTYLYATTTVGLPAAAGRVATILQPTAHDEPPLRVRLYDSLFRLPDGFLFFTPEERNVVRRRFGFEPVGETIGIGIDLAAPGSIDQFRQLIGIGDAPYVLYVGRIDAIKGSRELFEFFLAYKQRNPGPLKLVFVGERIGETPEHPDVLYSGFVDEATKHAALAGSVALMQPSRFESFSIVLCESWVQRRPALVHADSEVLRGQAMRSQGALPYAGFAEFEAALTMLVADADLAARLGSNGRRYVEQHYRWDAVLDGFERAATTAATRFASRRHA